MAMPQERPIATLLVAVPSATPIPTPTAIQTGLNFHSRVGGWSFIDFGHELAGSSGSGNVEKPWRCPKSSPSHYYWVSPAYAFSGDMLSPPRPTTAPLPLQPPTAVLFAMKKLLLFGFLFGAWLARAESPGHIRALYH